MRFPFWDRKYAAAIITITLAARKIQTTRPTIGATFDRTDSPITSEMAKSAVSAETAMAALYPITLANLLGTQSPALQANNRYVCGFTIADGKVRVNHTSNSDKTPDRPEGHFGSVMDRDEKFGAECAYQEGGNLSRTSRSAFSHLTACGRSPDTNWGTL